MPKIQQEQQEQQAIENILRSLQQKDQDYIKRYLNFLKSNSQDPKTRTQWTDELNSLLFEGFTAQNSITMEMTKLTIPFLAVSNPVDQEKTQGAQFNVNALIKAISSPPPQPHAQPTGAQPVETEISSCTIL